MSSSKHEDNIIHTHSSSFFSNKNTLLLLIPSIIFVSVLAYFLTSSVDGNKSISINRETPKEEELIEITIGTATVSAQMADTPAERHKGLRNRDNLAKDQAMLFVFDANDIEHVNFEMNGVKFPIDILWIDDGKVVQIDAHAFPEPADIDSPTWYPSKQPFDYVIEVVAGFSEENNVEIGTPVKFNLF